MSTTQETTIERSPVLLKLRVDNAGNLNVDANYHTLSAGNDYYDGNGGIGLAGCMSKEQADYIARACNNHEALVEALSLLVSFDDRQGMADHIREQSGNSEDAQTPEQAIYLHGISAARKALAALTAPQ